MALAYRQQRTLQRMQMRAMRRNSVLGPVMLLGLGILFLLIETDTIRWDATLLWMSRWWPLVLVSAGLVLLGEWIADTRRNRTQGTMLPRRTLSAGTVFLLVLLAAVGASATGIYRGSDWTRRNWNSDVTDAWGLQQVFSQRSDTQQQLQAPLSPGGLLTIENFRGNITVTGASSDGQVHVSAHQKTFAWQGNELRARKEQNRPRLETHGKDLLLSVHGEGHDLTDLTIEVPHESALQIGGEKGELQVSELRGPLTIQNHVGNIVLTALTGHVQVSVRDDNASVTGHSLSGDLTLEGRSGDLAFSDVTGPVTLHGDFFGTTHLERIHGPVHFQSSFTDFLCVGIPGEVNVEGRSELQARNLEGPLTISTSDRNLGLTGVRNGATITNRNGSVTLSMVDPLGPVKVTTTDGSIQVHIPEKAAFSLKAETANGQVNNDLGLRPVQRDERTSLAGQVRTGGPLVSLQTSEGDISIGTRGETKGADDADTSDADSSGEARLPRPNQRDSQAQVRRLRSSQ